jgi:hypothetical protein
MIARYVKDGALPVEYEQTVRQRTEYTRRFGVQVGGAW